MSLACLISVVLLPQMTDIRTPILTYHDVIPRRTSTSLWFDCSVRELETQIRAMKKEGAVFVTLAEVEAALTKNQPLPPRAIAITFADNYQGFYRYGYPILKRERVPGAMFVHTGYVGSKQGRPKMTWDQLRQLDREGWITIGSQTVTHRSLAGMPRNEVRKELRDSKAKLEQELGHPIRYLAYPNGSFDAVSVQEAKASGYALAFTERLKMLEQRPSLWEVPRWVHTKWQEAWRAGIRMPR